LFFSLETTKSYSRTVERKERTEWQNVFFGKMVGSVGKYLRNAVTIPKDLASFSY
jgi:hypothetical protein